MTFAAHALRLLVGSDPNRHARLNRAALALLSDAGDVATQLDQPIDRVLAAWAFHMPFPEHVPRSAADACVQLLDRDRLIPKPVLIVLEEHARTLAHATRRRASALEMHPALVLGRVLVLRAAEIESYHRELAGLYSAAARELAVVVSTSRERGSR